VQLEENNNSNNTEDWHRNMFICTREVCFGLDYVDEFAAKHAADVAFGVQMSLWMRHKES
jgi:hypothetical protein